MTDISISAGALKMARKMTATIFPRMAMKPEEKSALLTRVTVISLQDLLDDFVVWRKTPQAGMRLFLDDPPASLKPARQGDFTIQQKISDREVEKAVDWVEEVFDRYDLDEEERATLYTALPCLGLMALEEYLDWKKAPPFPILG